MYSFSAAGSPKFKAPLSSSPVMEGEEAMLKCELSKPNAAVQWFRNGEEIVPGEKYEATVTGKTHSLKIQDVCCDDSAEYTVKAGDNSSSCKLKVKGKETFLAIYRDFMLLQRDLHI